MSPLLTSNSELRPLGIRNWTLPAFVVTLPNGERFNVCPHAGVCARACYARFGAYRFSNVRAAHVRNLMLTLDDLDGWRERMIDELQTCRWARRDEQPHALRDVVEDADDWLDDWLNTGGKAVRIHDAGDFYSDDYLRAWLDIAAAVPDVLFYAYTKEITRFRRVVVDARHTSNTQATHKPPNFRFCFSFGGREDDLIDVDVDRHADVFPSRAALHAAGYFDQSSHDLLCVLAPSHKIGVVSNRLPVARSRMGDDTFASAQRSLRTSR